MMYLKKCSALAITYPAEYRPFALTVECAVFDSSDRIVGSYLRRVNGFIRWRNCGRPYIIFPGVSEHFGFASGYSVVFDSVSAIFNLYGVIVRTDRIHAYELMGVRPYGID